MSRRLHEDDKVSNPSDVPSLAALAAAAGADGPRRRLLLGSLGAALLPACAAGGAGQVVAPAAGEAGERMLGFRPVPSATGDQVLVPEGYHAQPLLPWGTPIDGRAPPFRPDAGNTAEEQLRQIGDNHDGLAYFGFDADGRSPGLRSDEGLLLINHEYINPEYFFGPPPPGLSADALARERVRKAQAGHGASVVHVRRQADGRWQQVEGARLSRRLHAHTPMRLCGPAAGHVLLRTAADPGGRQVLGMLGNCGSGRTPWGTYLSCEENFHGYFGWSGRRAATPLEARYGLSREGFGLAWHACDPRFDLDLHPHEAHRFGWVVEIDPFDPDALPRKQTALGRFKHENAEVVLDPDGRVVVYMGCDERNEYLYKFISEGRFDPRAPRSAANRRLLERGTLHVARFESGGGRWIPLVHGQHGLTAAHGFHDPGEVLVRARQAADRVGATPMDRPEWMAAHPRVPGEVYASLTHNPQRGGDTLNPIDGRGPAGAARPPVDGPNPRPHNVWGHILRWREAGGRAAALHFEWDLFALAGQPGIGGARAPSANLHAGNLFNSPDGLAFDAFGRLWIQTDGNCSNRGDFAQMGNNQMLAADPASGEIRRFLVGPSGCEVSGLAWTPDRRTLFVNIQHPGEIARGPGRHPRLAADPDPARLAAEPTLLSAWPASQTGEPPSRPRSATVAIWREDGGPVGG